MNALDLHRCIGQSVSERAGLMSELTAKLARIDKRDTELTEELIKMAPGEIRQWILNEAVLSQLFRYGKYDTKINFNDKNYNFKDLDDVTSKVRALGKAWTGIVQVGLSKNPEKHRISVRLSAAM